MHRYRRPPIDDRSVGVEATLAAALGFARGRFTVLCHEARYFLTGERALEVNPCGRIIDVTTLPPQLVDYRFAARPTEVAASTDQIEYLLTGAVDFKAIEDPPPQLSDLLEFGERW